MSTVKSVAAGAAVAIVGQAAIPRHHDSQEQMYDGDDASLDGPYQENQVTTTSVANETKKVPLFVHFMAGGISGTVAAVATCPLEVVKTRLQSSMYAQMAVTQNQKSFFSPFRDLWRVLIELHQKEGPKGLFLGLGANVIGVMPARATYFGTYSYVKDLLSGGQSNSTPLIHCLSGVAAGFATTTLTNPIWVVKTRLQLQQDVNQSTFQCLRNIAREEGLRGLYRGLSASYVGIAESTLQWILYEQCKEQMASYRRLNPSAHEQFDYLLVAGFAKFVAAAALYPHEVLRTRLRQQSTPTSLWQMTRFMLKTEPWQAFYGGMTAHLIRVVPNSAIMFFCYEALVRHWKS